MENIRTVNKVSREDLIKIQNLMKDGGFSKKELLIEMGLSEDEYDKIMNKKEEI